MKIFILPGTLHCNNLGDLAMLQVALQRLKKIWPNAAFFVLTGAEAKLKIYCPEAVPVPVHGLKCWLKAGALPKYLFPGIKAKVRRKFPFGRHKLLPLARLFNPRAGLAANRFARAFFKADLVVLSGCGLITDAFKQDALLMLDGLAAAKFAGIPAVMLGQGLGPIQDPGLLDRVKQVLPSVDMIFLREQIASLELLQTIYVPDKKILGTGDDAVDLAYSERRPHLGKLIGINLRLATYASLNEAALPIIREVLQAKARHFQTDLIGLPILLGSKKSDVQALESLVEAHNAGVNLASPIDVIRQVSHCRIVVTGSYHAAVFALAQGIPVIGIAQSKYYQNKFRGLANEYGSGCAMLQPDDANFSKKLAAAIDQLWGQAEELKPKLLLAAERQIQNGRSAYARLPELMSTQHAAI
ncbi:MAG: polysaccharide pyruvyl transferase family protein [Verrucomicrobiae bacterium]